MTDSAPIGTEGICVSLEWAKRRKEAGWPQSGTHFFFANGWGNNALYPDADVGVIEESNHDWLAAAMYCYLAENNLLPTSPCNPWLP